MESIFGGASLLGPGLYLEKPVRPASYLRCIQQALGMEAIADNSDNTVRQQLMDLIRGADSGTLSRMASALKKEPPS
jgi:hypothetical protein